MAHPALSTVLPEFAMELERLLLDIEEKALAEQSRGLVIFDRCRCGDDFCGSFRTGPKPNGAYGPGHRNVACLPSRGWVILDVVDGKIMYVEVLYRDEVRDALMLAMP